MRNRSARRRNRGFSLVEIMIGMIAASILLLGMGAVLVMIYRGFNESHNFSEATTRVDLIRQLSFDARTARNILYPTNWDVNGVPLDSRGDYSSGGFVGDRVQFVSLRFDGTTTTPFLITWQSKRPAAAAPTDPYNVERWIQEVDAGNNPIGVSTLTFDQNKINYFEVVRTTIRTFRVNMQTTESTETATVQMVVTCRNVIN
ncbi:MAG: prepilin-type N-terminal cleavage/methylation domain-containing protein [Planctomycetes bacterium]|jgi:Tfp pilus assembly protein PilV|nr:prepilin-type N-terminal cleavage/methylation domain-containing protein [Planctomycetota bacterium]MCL4730285.1 prepilin-type N-terminal cleavage/methylation domain-containing protein [Planctomycetota bacterium]